MYFTHKSQHFKIKITYNTNSHSTTKPACNWKVTFPKLRPFPYIQGILVYIARKFKM